VSAPHSHDPVRIKDGIARAEAASWEAIVGSMRTHILLGLAHS